MISSLIVKETYHSRARTRALNQANRRRRRRGVRPRIGQETREKRRRRRRKRRKRREGSRWSLPYPRIDRHRRKSEISLIKTYISHWNSGFGCFYRKKNHLDSCHTTTKNILGGHFRLIGGSLIVGFIEVKIEARCASKSSHTTTSWSGWKKNLHFFIDTDNRWFTVMNHGTLIVYYAWNSFDQIFV